MGSLRQLHSPDQSVHLFMSSSNLAEIYVYDTLKGMCGATTDSILDVSNKSAFYNMLDLVGMQPLLAEKWLFVISFKGGLKQLVRKHEGIFRSETARFLVKVDSYKDFKEFKEFLRSANDLYLNTISGRDVSFLLKDFPISSNVMDFVQKSYFRDPDKVFGLYKELSNGAEVSSTKDVVKLCGESASSVVRFAMLLLNEFPSTAAGLKRVYSKRVKILEELCNSFGPRSAYNFLSSSIRDITDIKMLYLSGNVYDSLRNLPEGFDEKKLARYNMYLKRISTIIPYEDILRLRVALCKCPVWVTPQDGLLFLYDYYLKGMEVSS